MADQVKIINDKIGEDGFIDLEPVIQLGRNIYQSGANTLETFTARAKELLSDVWEKVKDLIRQAWDVISNESGKISFGKKGKSDTIKNASQQTPGETIPATAGSIKSDGGYEFLLNIIKQRLKLPRALNQNSPRHLKTLRK